ncbi:MAG: 2TM domain-containing protein [Anaerolineae bacterium]|nr:2TM domain-containing protein [Anaerolineae bacterium]
MSDQINYEQIRARVTKRVNQRKEVLIHVGVYIIVNVLIWAVWLLLRADWFTFSLGSDFDSVVRTMRDFPVAPMVTFGWLIGLLIHAYVVYLESNVIDKMADREMKIEIERERERLYGQEKPKREMRLTDDGELEEVDEVSEERRRRARSTR